jgi:hypothetical protein
MAYFTKENAREMQARGTEVKMRFQTPERRKYLARRARLKGWYRSTGSAIERVECLIRFFAMEVAEALLKDDHEFAVRTASAMLGWERLKISLESGTMKDVTPELTKEIEDKLGAARARREKELTEDARTVDTSAG